MADRKYKPADLASAVSSITAHPRFPMNRGLSAGWIRKLRSTPVDRFQIRAILNRELPPVVK